MIHMSKMLAHDKRKLDKKICAIVEQYLKDIIKNGVPVKAAYVFGSQVTGQRRPDSDIDVCIISPLFKNEWWKTQMRLRSIRRQIDLRIEPHGFAPEDFIPEHPLAAEIKREGVRMR